MQSLVGFFYLTKIEGGREKGEGRRARLYYTFLVSLSSFLIPFWFLVFAQDPSQRQLELEQNINNTQTLLQQREQEIASIEAELGETSAELEAQIAERDNVSSQLAALREEGAALTESISALETQLADTQGKLGELQVEVADLKTRVQELLVGVYTQRSGRYAQVLSKADSLHDLQVKNYYLSLLSDQDVDLVTELSLKATELINLQTAQNEQMNELLAKRTELEGNQVALEIAQADLETIVANLNATQEGQLATQKDLLESQASLEATIAETQNQLQGEIARLQEEAKQKREAAARAADSIQKEQLTREAEQVEQQATNLTAPRPTLKSGYITPVDYAQVLGKSGSGVTIRANSIGAKVYAVQPGIVIQAVSIGANDGYIVVLEHSEGLITAYSNLQGVPPVKVGQQIAQGDVLGYLGGGALVPQDVLKFYIKKNDSYVDPTTVIGM